MTHILHFTIGPVQGFVTEARRTRDLWAGSFLLSWLSAQAMYAVTNVGGTIAFPAVDDDELFQAVRDHKGSGLTQKSPYIGSVPNRFKAHISDTFDPNLCADAVREAWTKLADSVWAHFLEDVALAHGNGTKVIWDRQIANFWQIAWVKGSNPGDGSDGAWLDQRKNLRTHYPEHEVPGDRQSRRYQEGGDHCQLMGTFQELSGYVRAKGDRASQDAFWNALRDHGFELDDGTDKRIGELNLRDNERLCAIALVKRLFPVLPKEKLKRVMGWVPGAAEDLNLERWPSVSYIAAVPWLDEVWQFGEKHEVTNACATYKDCVVALTKEAIFGETEKGILGLQRFENNFFKLDGHFFHTDAIRSMDLDRFKGADETEQKFKRDSAEKALNDLHDHVAKAYSDKWKDRAGTENGSTPPPAKLPPLVASEFYAVLIADGDHIGANLHKPNGEADAKKGLADFTRTVPDIVKKQAGVTIYAGGDDVLALLPLDTAICGAIELRQAYVTSFRHSETTWTLSAAIIFAQYKIPFRAVLAEAHRQLDKTAKEKNGRDSLALAVMKPGGIAFDWVSAWSTTSVPAKMQHMAQELQAKREFTTGFLHNICERYEPLFGFDDDPEGPPLVEQKEFRQFLVAEHKKSGGKKEDAGRLVEELMIIGYPIERKEGVESQSAKFRFDAGLVMRFLAEEGRWFMGEKE